MRGDLPDTSARALLALGLISDEEAEESNLTTAVRVETDDVAFTPGTVVASRFRITALIGRGGMGDVYRADDLKLGQPVALKFLPGASGTDAAMVRVFHDEVRIGRQVAHPNVCRIYDLLDVEGRPAIVMEFVEGEDLASLLKRIGRLPYRKALEIARDVCAGVDAAHAKGIIHGDLKPANIVIDGRGRARITDFGLSRLAEDVSVRLAGTPAYMAPEQFTGEASSQRADIYALGLVLYEIFTGVRARQVSSVSEAAAFRATPPPPSMQQPSIDPQLAAAMMRCLRPDGQERPSSARVILAAFPPGDILDAVLAAGETPPSEFVAESQKVHELAPGQARLVAIAATGLLILVTVLSQHLTLYGRWPLPLNPSALTQRAKSAAQRVGAVGPFADQARWFESDLDAVPPRIVFHYRASPSALVTSALDGHIRADDPPLDAPGAVHVALSTTGRLLLLRSVAHDARHRGWIVWFEESGPAPVKSRHVMRDSSLPRVVYFLLLLSALLAGAYLAWRNVRRRRVDGRGAWRTALWVLVCRALYGLIAGHHPLSLDKEPAFLASVVATSLLLAAQVWLGYVALEPYVRRRWPEAMVGWARVVHGRFRDGVVGRDLLLGVLAGLTLRLFDHIRNVLPFVTPSHLAVEALSSTREALGGIFLYQARAIFYALFSLFLLVLLRIVLKRHWLAAAVWLAATTAAWIRWDAPLVDVPIVGAQMAILLIVLHRVGLLAAAAAIFVHLVTVYTPLTADPQAFYFAQSAVALAVLAAMIGYGSYTATASNPAESAPSL